MIIYTDFGTPPFDESSTIDHGNTIVSEDIYITYPHNLRYPVDLNSTTASESVGVDDSASQRDVIDSSMPEAVPSLVDQMEIMASKSVFDLHLVKNLQQNCA